MLSKVHHFCWNNYNGCGHEKTWHTLSWGVSIFGTVDRGGSHFSRTRVNRKPSDLINDRIHYLSVRLHSWSNVNRVSKQAVSRHLDSYNSSHSRPRVNTYTTDCCYILLLLHLYSACQHPIGCSKHTVITPINGSWFIPFSARWGVYIEPKLPVRRL